MRWLERIFHLTGKVAFLVSFAHFWILMLLDAGLMKLLQRVQGYFFPDSKPLRPNVFFLFHIFMRMGMYFCGTKVVTDYPKDFDFDSDATLVLVNHTNRFDPIPIIISIPGEVSFLAKAEALRVPVLRVLLELAGTIPIERAQRDEARAQRDEARASIGVAARHLRSGRHVCIFPEGTRNKQAESEEGRLLPLKMGAFHCASEAGRRIVLMRCEGMTRAWPDKGLFPRAGTVRLRIFSVIPPEESANVDPKELQKRVSADFEADKWNLPEVEKQPLASACFALGYLILSCVPLWVLTKII